MVVKGNKVVKCSRVTLKKRKTWSVREKLMVLHYYDQVQNVRATARHFDIETKQVRDWRNNRENLKTAAPHLLKLHKGRPPFFSDLEDELAVWITECREKHLAITRNMAIKKAIELSKTNEYQTKYPNINSFKFSRKWLDCFMVRYNLSNRRRTTVSQHLPENLLETQQCFLSYVLYMRIQHNYPLQLIGNMDETPMSFDLPSSYTLEKRGSSTVNIKTTGHEKSTFTVVLGVMSDGRKLPPVVIFKLKNVPREEFPDGIYVRVNPKGWMNQNEMLWWINNIWIQRTAELSNPRSLLVLDSFRGHLVDTVKQEFNNSCTNIAVIPGGLTSRLQPLDVGINKSFKSKVSLILIIKIINNSMIHI